MNDKLTTQSYWESYYKNNHADKAHIEAVCSRYDTYWEQFITRKDKEQTIIEIGGFPGRYLGYLAHRYQLVPTSLDYNSDHTQLEATFKLMGVDTFHILQEDFTQYQPESTYDYVLSNGFIEHFENFDSILDHHVPYMNDDAKLLVMIPNMRGYIKFYKYLVDYQNLTIHNLKSMRLKVFRDFAERNDLKINYLSYFGGFPFGVHQKLTFIQKVIYQIHRRFFKKIGNAYLEKHPSRFFSSSIVAIFEKN
ncbi:MAG: class I SAM-dependent methyltransferase [Algicola sp.]|nr:class I SAM-dependent methyltransferase [Algicola sp.]